MPKRGCLANQMKYRGCLERVALGEVAEEEGLTLDLDTRLQYIAYSHT